MQLRRMMGKAAGHIPGAAGRGQLSVETLLVFLIFLMVLGIALFASSRIVAAAQNQEAYALSKSSFEEFSSKLSQACSLGNGNVRRVGINGAPAAVSADGNALEYRAGNFSARLNSSCGISVLRAGAADVFKIDNVEGKIEIS